MSKTIKIKAHTRNGKKVKAHTRTRNSSITIGGIKYSKKSFGIGFNSERALIEDSKKSSPSKRPSVEEKRLEYEKQISSLQKTMTKYPHTKQ
jgi:hypothetical protein